MCVPFECHIKTVALIPLQTQSNEFVVTVNFVITLICLIIFFLNIAIQFDLLWSMNIKFECEVQCRITWIWFSSCNCFRQYLLKFGSDCASAKRWRYFGQNVSDIYTFKCYFASQNLNRMESNRPIGTGFYFSWDIYAYKYIQSLSSSLRGVLLSIDHILSREKKKKEKKTTYRNHNSMRIWS